MCVVARPPSTSLLRHWNLEILKGIKCTVEERRGEDKKRRLERKKRREEKNQNKIKKHWRKKELLRNPWRRRKWNLRMVHEETTFHKNEVGALKTLKRKGNCVALFSLLYHCCLLSTTVGQGGSRNLMWYSSDSFTSHPVPSLTVSANVVKWKKQIVENSTSRMKMGNKKIVTNIPASRKKKKKNNFQKVLSIAINTSSFSTYFSIVGKFLSHI